MLAAPTEPMLLRGIFGLIRRWLDSGGDTDLPDEWLESNPPHSVDVSDPAAVQAWLDAFSRNASDPSYWTFHESQIGYCTE